MLMSAALTPSVIGRVAGVLVVVQVIPYLVSIFADETRPQRTAYAIWSIINVVSITSYIASGATTTIWTGLAYAATAWLIFGLSLKYGNGGFNRLDISCFCIALAAITLWVDTSNPVIALYATLVADVIAYIPLARKAWARPETENTLSWCMASLTGLLNLLALTSFRPEIYLPPLQGAACTTLIAGMLLFSPRCRRQDKFIDHGTGTGGLASAPRSS
jgi:hypothetical protein